MSERTFVAAVLVFAVVCAAFAWGLR